MKKVSLPLAFMFVTAMLFISSCGKKSDSSSTPGKITFTANGTNYSYTSPDGMLATTSGNVATATSADANNSSNSFIVRVTPNASGTYAYSVITSLEWLVNSKVYVTDPANSQGTISLNISGATATSAFTNAILYNSSNFNDSIIITNGAYSGKYYSL
ncbi:MAG: hypothetical protein JWO06_4053 [Bacteroidota bacterium]|nr:hypothetical protein [Bacteroidota bacterium]